MRHYCNRQNPDNRKKMEINDDSHYIKTQIQADSIPPKKTDGQISEDDETEPIFPPSSFSGDIINSNPLYEAQINAAEYDAQGGSVSQRGGFVKQLTEDEKNSFIKDQNYSCRACGEIGKMPSNAPVRFNDMSGSVGFISVPAIEPQRTMAMPAYLSAYKGKYICIDLWSSDGRRVEKCGTLLETGDDFLVIRKGCTGEITIIDLRTIRYISIYCR